MSIAIAETIHVLQIIVQTVPLGTNLALLQLMWTILNGSFLQSRGAIFPALAANGLHQKKAGGFGEPSVTVSGASMTVWRNGELMSWPKGSGSATATKGIGQWPWIGRPSGDSS